ncbi:MAG: phosphoenolpyruvate--protein phosphotransferase [Planctomycetota bacterium]
MVERSRGGTMQILQGIAVSPGIAIGEALVISNEGFRIPRRFVLRDAVVDELQRLHSAMDAVAADIERNRQVVAEELGDQTGAIFGAHLQLLRDPRLVNEISALVREHHYSPEYAINTTIRRYVKVLRDLKISSLAERANDLFDIEKHLLQKLLGFEHGELRHLTSPVIVLASNLTPSETATLDRQHVLGFVTESGGEGGHTAIVAKALELPAIVGTGQFLADVAGGDMVIVDGEQGRVILSPDEETLKFYRRMADLRRTHVQELAGLRDLPAETADGVHVVIDANIEFPEEVTAVLRHGAEGIGLYRTEFLYLGAEHEPTEEEQFNAYAQVVSALAGRAVTIRTLDLGADKLQPEDAAEGGKNPFLGLRSIRLSLRELPRFRTQLRAILRASALGKVKVMFPLVSTLGELRRAKMLLADAMEDLEEQGIPFDRHLSVGMMVEVPAAVMMLDRFLREVDFLSIGTNDLIQYALAVDRGNMDVAELYSASDPAVLRLIDLSLNYARQSGIPTSLCGQMSGSTRYTALLLGMGLRSFSVPPGAVPEIKRMCRNVTLPLCQEIARRALLMDDAAEVDRFLLEEARKVSPEMSGY